MSGVISVPRLCGNESEYDDFWNINITWNTYSPDFTRCFQSSMLLCIPCVFMLIAGTILAVIYNRAQTLFRWKDKSLLNKAKLGLAGLLLVVTFAALCADIHNSIHLPKETPPIRLISSLLQMSAFSIATWLIHLEFRAGTHTSGVQQIFWAIIFLSSVISVRSAALQSLFEDRPLERLTLVYVCVRTVLIGCLLLLTLFADISVFSDPSTENDEVHLLLQKKKTSKATSHVKVKPCPKTRSSFAVNLLFLWFARFIYLQWKSPLTFNDMTDLLEKDKSEYLNKKFEYYWKAELEKNGNTSLDSLGSTEKNKGRPSLLRALLYTCCWKYILQNCLRGLALCVTFCNPLLLRALLEFIEAGDDMVWKGVLMGFGMAIITCVSAILQHNSVHLAFVTGMNVRTIITAAVYRKSLKLSNAAKKKTTLGEITNLMSVDAQKLQEMASISNTAIVLPIAIPLCCVLLMNAIGTPGLYGIAVLVIIIPVVGVICTRKIRQFQGTQMKWKDRRIRTIGEILSGIKVLKLYSWEKPFEEKVTNYRDEELKTILRINIVDAISYVVWSNSVYVVNFIIFGIFLFSSSDNILDPSKVFVTFSLVNILAMPMMVLPLGITWIGQGFIALGRITNFLLLEEQADSINYTGISDYAIEMKSASFTWDNKERPFLESINVAVSPGELVAVVGQVGSGKSSLASALLGEMNKVDGEVNIKGTLAYVPQHAWIQNATLKDNIIFGNKKDEAKYQYILDACALRPDLKILADGDMTEIGEKGINLSGGQKQRVSVARAVYQDSDIFILDDPLSAVDAHVASQLFNKVIGPSGVLAQKTRVLITHGVTYLPNMDRIIVMKDGKIAKMGTYQQLIDENGFFSEFLLTYANTNQENTPTESSGSTTPLLPRRRNKSKISPMATSMTSSVSMIPDQRQKLITQELEHIGNIKMEVLKDYGRSWGKLPAILAVLFNVCFIACVVSGQIWLSKLSTDSIDLSPSEQSALTNYRFNIYAVIIVAQVISASIVYVSLGIGCTSAAAKLHSRIIARLLKAPISFFDTTPLGRVMNRCSKDIDLLDVNTPIFLRLWLSSTNPIIATFIIIIYSTPWFLIIALPIMFLYVFIQRVYINTARQLKRIDSVRKSPVFSHYEESVTGTTSIRAYGKVQEFIEKSDILTDESQRPYYLVNVAARWLSVVLDGLGSLVIISATLLALQDRGEDGSGTAGLSISYTLQISMFLLMFVRSATELETYMVAAERVKEYSEINTEADYENSDTKPEGDWPSSGGVKYSEYCTRYRPGLDLILQDISFDIQGSEKIGVVGRTGAGKSSVALSLFRIIESAGGAITIDGVPIHTLGLDDLRSKLTIIPQDPVVFSGSLRFNVDPLCGATDSQVWHALEQAHLKKFVVTLSEGLEYDCGENGSNLSVGQRQLVCLARALLRKTKILLLDEATSGVDLETDNLIQTTIRTSFKECTVITIAHRINTILDYDRVMVLDAGRIIEFDSPTTLLENKDSVFSSLVNCASVPLNT